MKDVRMYCFLPFSALLNPLDTKTVEQMLQITNVWEPMFAVKILLRWTPKQTTLAFPVPRSQEENSNTSLTSFCFQNQINLTLLHWPFIKKDLRRSKLWVYFCSYNNWILTKSNGKSVFLIEKTRGKNVMYHISSLSCVKISNGKIVLLIVAEILILFLPLYKLLSPPHHVLLTKQGQIQLPTPPLKVSSVTTSTSPYTSENFNRKVAFLPAAQRLSLIVP